MVNSEIGFKIIINHTIKNKKSKIVRKIKPREFSVASDCRKRIYIKIVIVNFCYIAKSSLEGRWHSDLSL